MAKLIATWNTARGVWEQPTTSLLCGHSVPYSQVWPSSGTMQNGICYEQPTQAQLTTENEYLYLPTPKARDYPAEGYEAGLRRSQPQLGTVMRSLLPTPMASDTFTDNLKSTQQKEGSMHSVTHAQVVKRPDLLPTPTTMDNLPAREGEAYEKAKNVGGRKNRATTGNLREAVIHAIPSPLLPTPMANSYRGPANSEVEAGDPKHRFAVAAEIINRSGTWGKYEPAIRRWEQTINTPAPTATIPDGRDGNHRLNPEFAEWLMGIPGRLDGLDLTRAERLKMAGNGVCPQQAELALTILIERLNTNE